MVNDGLLEPLKLLVVDEDLVRRVLCRAEHGRSHAHDQSLVGDLVAELRRLLAEIFEVGLSGGDRVRWGRMRLEGIGSIRSAGLGSEWMGWGRDGMDRTGWDGIEGSRDRKMTCTPESNLYLQVILIGLELVDALEVVAAREQSL